MAGVEAPCALIVMGVSGSGKSTVAELLGKRLGWRFEDGDSFHPASNVEKMRAGHPLTDEDRWPWLNAIADEIARVCDKGEHVITVSIDESVEAIVDGIVRQLKLGVARR